MARKTRQQKNNQQKPVNSFNVVTPESVLNQNVQKNPSHLSFDSNASIGVVDNQKLNNLFKCFSDDSINQKKHFSIDDEEQEEEKSILNQLVREQANIKNAAAEKSFQIAKENKEKIQLINISQQSASVKIRQGETEQGAQQEELPFNLEEKISEYYKKKIDYVRELLYQLSHLI